MLNSERLIQNIFFLFLKTHILPYVAGKKITKEKAGDLSTLLCPVKKTPYNTLLSEHMPWPKKAILSVEFGARMPIELFVGVNLLDLKMKVKHFDCVSPSEHVSSS